MVDIATKLGSSFSLVPFVIVVVRLLLFHVLVDSFELACICTKIICMSQLVTSVLIVIYKLLNNYLATGICHVAGGVHHPGDDCHLTTSSAFLLPYTSCKEGNSPPTCS